MHVPIIQLDTEYSCSNSFLGSERRRCCTSVSASKIWTSRYILLTRPARSVCRPASPFCATEKRSCESRWVRRRKRREAHSGNSNAQRSMLIPIVVRLRLSPLRWFCLPIYKTRKPRWSCGSSNLNQKSMMMNVYITSHIVWSSICLSLSIIRYSGPNWVETSDRVANQ